MREVQDRVAASSVGAAGQVPVLSIAVLCTVHANVTRVGDGASRPSKKRLVSSAWHRSRRLRESVTDLLA